MYLFWRQLRKTNNKLKEKKETITESDMMLIKDDIQLLYFTNNMALMKRKLGHLPSVTMIYKIKG